MSAGPAATGDGLVVAAPAKLNLRLLVGPLGSDGYHPVRTLMVALDGLADDVAITPAAVRSVTCPGVDERANLAWRALDALETAAGRPLPCAVRITKRIPERAGLGGGSSDAAATLVGANALFGLGMDAARLEAVAARVGSDVAFFVRGGCRWAGGRGELLGPEEIPPAFAAVVAKPRWGLATPDVYRAFDLLPPPPPDDGRPVPADAAGLAGWVRNDLWPAARSLRPQLDRVAGALLAAGALATLLCGSGTAIAGLFGDAQEARAAAARLDDVVAVVTPGGARRAVPGL